MTAITATPQLGSGLTPPRVLLQVTGAPNPPTNSYASNFATLDGWSGASAALLLGGLRLSGPASQPAGTTSTGQRTVTGLSVGVAYKYRASITTQTQTQARLRISGGAQGSYVITPPGGAWVELTFTATATSHVIMIDLQNTSANTSPIVDVASVTVQPSGTWQGTTIRRTDANGTSVVVREDAGGMDVSGGTMTLYDLEAALTGVITYTVTDGTGVVVGTATSFATEARRNRVHNPSFETNTTFWAGTNGTIARTVTSTAPFGTAVLTYTSNVAGAGAGTYQINTALIPVTPGEVLTASASAKALVTSSPYTIVINWYNAANAFVSSSAAGTTPGPISGSVFTRLSTTATAPATATQARVVIFPTLALPVGAGYVVDGVMLELGGLGDYFDGSTPDPGLAKTRGWLYPPNGSQSIEVGSSTEALPWFTIPATAVPSAGTVTALSAQAVLDYDESSKSNGSLHVIIGRSDPVANPGPLGLRQGSLDVFCADYATARALRAMLSTGDVAQLRQPTHPGMDLYFVPQLVRIAPASDVTTPRRWVATVDYAEVLAA